MSDSGKPERDESGLSRRTFLQGTGGFVAVATVAPEVSAGSGQSEQLAAEVPTTWVRINVNGIRHDIEVEDRWTLVEVLPDHRSMELGIYAVYPSRKQLAPKVRLLVDFLVESFVQHEWCT